VTPVLLKAMKGGNDERCKWEDFLKAFFCDPQRHPLSDHLQMGVNEPARK
jgi:hypothetical protein